MNYIKKEVADCFSNYTTEFAEMIMADRLEVDGSELVDGLYTEISYQSSQFETALEEIDLDNVKDDVKDDLYSDAKYDAKDELFPDTHESDLQAEEWEVLEARIEELQEERCTDDLVREKIEEMIKEILAV
jgi:hypothetical protein